MATARALRCVRGVLVGLLLYGLTGAPLTQAAAPDKPASGSWSLLLESQGADGAWSTFATCTLTRPVHQ